MKKIVIMSITIILIIILLIVGNQDNLKFKRMFESQNNKYAKVEIPKNNKVNILSTKETEEYLKNGTGVILIGKETDNKTRKILPIILDLTNDKETEFNYLDQEDVNKNITKKIKETNYPLIIYTVSGKIEAISKYEKNKTNKDLKKEYTNNIDKLYGVCDASC